MFNLACSLAYLASIVNHKFTEMALAIANSAIEPTLLWSSNHPVLVVATAVCLYVASIIVYRLYLSPLAGIPGPKLAGKYENNESDF